MSYGDDDYTELNALRDTVPSMFRIINMIESAPFKVTTVGCGWVCSAALDIFITGDKRLLWPNSTLLSHQGTDFHYGKIEDAKRSVAEQERVHGKVTDHYERYTSMTREEIGKFLMPEHDVYVTPEEALLFGMCDEIVEPKIRRKKPKRSKALEKFLARSSGKKGK